MSNTIHDLREQLFDTLRQLKDKQNPMDIQRARAISDVAGRIIESAKVEVDYSRVTGELLDSQFIPLDLPGRKPSTQRPALTAPKADAPIDDAGAASKPAVTSM